MLPPPTITVSSTIQSAQNQQKALDLASRLQLPLTSSIIKAATEFVLAYTPKGLQLLHMSSGSEKGTCLLFVDFVHGKNGFRFAHNCTIKQPLARAAGIKPGFRPSVLDGTAGLGTDAFVLASLGCRVTLCEQSPLIGALLEDGLHRAENENKTAEIVGKKMHLVVEDTKKFLQQDSETFHTIYLDPMYPHRHQSALNKQSLRVIRTLVGDDIDGPALLETALAKAENRVVVKRPRKAPLLSRVRPSHVILMKNSRFDIYLTFNQ